MRQALSRCLFLLTALAVCMPCRPTSCAWAADPAPHATVMAAADVSAETPASLAADPSAEAVQTAWAGLLKEQQRALEEARRQTAELESRLNSAADGIIGEMAAMEDELGRLSAIARASRAMPTERMMVVKRVHRLQERLQELTAPLQSGLTSLSSRLEELTDLENSNQTVRPDAGMASFHTGVNEARRALTLLQSRLNRILQPASALENKFNALDQSLNESMPELWRNYYLAPEGRLYDLASWRADADRLPHLGESLVPRLVAEAPQNARLWAMVFARALTALLPLGLLLFLSRKPARRMPDPLRQGWLRITGHSGVWLLAGLCLHYAAWSGGNHYQFVSALGTLCLCWGQMTLAWDLYAVGRPDAPLLTPLRPLFLPLMAGLLLLLCLDAFPALLGFLWLMVLALVLWRGHRRRAPTESLPRALLTGLTATAWISLLMTLFGYARLSILLSMGYTALAVCIQQALSIVHLGNIVEEFLPKEGGRALVAGLLMALVLPAVLLVATLTPVLWILAYPGGGYLLQHTAQLGFSVGQVSVNMVQIASIFIAFYLTRSLISVGLTFMKGLRQQGSRLDASLMGPLQAAYTYLLWVFFALYVLSSLGFSLTSLAVVAGGLSVGVGFGLQNIVQNFTSGLMVIFGQIIREGDFVEVGGVTGTVRKVNIRSTQVETPDNATVFIPNSQFLSGTFTNWTHNGRMVRREVAVGVAYGSDLALCMKLLTDVAAEHPKVLRTPAPVVFFTDFAASSLNLLLRYWVADIDHGMETMTALRLSINDVFAANGIEISFPQMDIHIRHEVGQEPTQAPALSTPEALR